MRIAYCTNVRLPSERAHGHQIAQVCDALAALGHDVHIFVPFRRNVIREDYWTYYGANKAVQLHHLGTFDPIQSMLPGVSKLWVLNALLRRELKKALPGKSFDLIYTRSPALLPVLEALGLPVVLELHQLPRLGRRAFVKRCNRCALIVCLTSAMRDTLKDWGVEEDCLMVAGDGVDLRRFEHLPKQSEARAGLPIPNNRLVVGYVGRLKTLGMEKGVGVLLEALKVSQRRGEFFGLIVGGPEIDRQHYEQQARELGLTAEDVLFVGEVEAKRVPTLMAACDILTMLFPNFPHYRHHMSPLKMFEYMAAGKVILTSDLPTIRDVLSEKTAVFCKPGGVQSAADALIWILDHPAESAMKAGFAKELVVEHTWEERMRRILNRATMAAQ